jgi:hypothetical protein
MVNNEIVIIGVFTQPYMRVEENEDIISLCNRLLNNGKIDRKEQLHVLLLFSPNFDAFHIKIGVYSSG